MFWHEYAKIPRHTSQNSFHCRRQSGMNFGYVTVNGVNSNIMPNIKGKYTRIVLTFLWKCDKKRISELNMCNVITQRLHRT